jgi:outer membrane protein
MMHKQAHMWRVMSWALFVLWAAAADAQPAAPMLTLEQAVEEALLRNVQILNQHDATEQAALGVRLARNTFQPKVTPNVLGSFGRTNINSQNYRVDFSQKFVNGTEVRVATGTSTAQIPSIVGEPSSDIRFYNADTTFTLSQPLMRGLGTSVTRRALTSAETRRADADRQRTLAEQQVALEVASAYYQIVAQQKLLEAARLSLQRARRLRDGSEARLDAGLVSQLDVLRSQQLVTQAELQLFDAESAQEDARDRLLFLIGRDDRTPFSVAMEVARPNDEPIAADTAIAAALTNRLDLKSLVASGVDADRQVSFAKNQLLPQVDVNVNYTRRQTADSFAHSFGVDRFQLATFLTIAMPVDRTPQLVEYQNALIERDRHAREVATLRHQIADDVRRAVRERDRLLRGLAAAENTVAIAEREVAVAQLRFERGLSNNLDVVTAESNLLAAQSRRIQNLADSAVAGLRVRAVLGTLNPRNLMSAKDASSAPDGRSDLK